MGRGFMAGAGTVDRGIHCGKRRKSSRRVCFEICSQILAGLRDGTNVLARQAEFHFRRRRVVMVMVADSAIVRGIGSSRAVGLGRGEKKERKECRANIHGWPTLAAINVAER